MKGLKKLETGTDLRVVSVNLQSYESDVSELKKLLSPQELSRAASYGTEALSRGFIMRRGLLRSLLGLQLNCDPSALTFHYGEYGKPQIAAPFFFNASSSFDEVVFAFSAEREVGIDIERIREFSFENMITDHFTTERAEMILNAPIDQSTHAFFREWVRKEAQLKALGLGIAAEANDGDTKICTSDLQGPQGYAVAVAQVAS